MWADRFELQDGSFSVSEFLFIKVWFTDQNSKPLEIYDKINITVS